jgi:hypothetical protein
MIIAASLLGCASPHRELALEPVGPAPYPGEGGGTQGLLVVFSALDPAPDFNSSPYHRRHIDYRVLSADGKQVIQTVHNDTGKLLEGPARVELRAGTYHVLARANGYGTVAVPVVIKPNQVTTVHLEGSTWWPRGSGIIEANPVRLPSGAIVGWRADLAQPH